MPGHQRRAILQPNKPGIQEDMLCELFSKVTGFKFIM